MIAPPMRHGHTLTASDTFLADGGEMGERVRARSWSTTPLGSAEAWPQSLRTAVCLVLHAKQPMFVAWGPDLTFLYNDEYAAVLGAKHPHALGQPFSQAWSDIWPQFGPIVRRVMAGEALSFEDLPIPMRRNGYDEDTWFSFSYTPLQDETEQIAGLFCACTETTSKVRGEQALRAQEALLEARVIERTAELDRVWRNSRDLLLVVDADGIFRALNPAWTAVLGYELDELVGRSFLDFIWPEDVTLTQGGHDRAVARDDLNGFENRYRHKDGTPRWISWNTSVEGELIYAYGRHITAEKEHAEALRRIEDQLRQAQKMEAVGQLTGGLAHDFNNLLTGVSGSLELLQTRIAQGRINDVDRYVNAAQGAAKRAAALTHRLLAFSRRQTLDPKPIVVNRLVRGMEELIRRTIGPEIALEVAEAGGLWTTLVDPGQLENALLNLCINARDSMLGGGRITIETANKWLDAAAAHERDLPPGQYVTLCVSDTGTGMAPDVIAKAFEPFFTTKPIGMGTGLGLSMVYGFVRQSNGQVRIYSEVGHGSNICLYLPRHLGADEADDLLPELAQAPRAEQGETVLVVDDEPTVRMLVSEVLEDLGYTAIEAADGAAGLKVLQSDVRLDLLVSDVGLPSMNGRQLADAAREVRPDLKVLFITGYAENAVLSHGHLEHGMHVLTKPFTMEALASRIKELINGK
ncbi:PAS domain-containing sensor histidine kinase [Roseomonas sp. KE2513]|nr:PAS domain-containing sensor histidine kinase [Roseomonas sp. KE2513]